MSTPMANNGDKTPMKKADVYTEYILWFAMPPEERFQLGIKTQTDFVERYGLSNNTPARWRDRRDFESRVDKIQRMWALDKTAAVIQGIYKAAVKGNPMSQMLWLQYFKKWNPKSEIEHTTKVEISNNDIRHLIEAMPEPYRSKHYGNFRELFSDAVYLRDSGRLEDGSVADEPADDVRGETDHDAPGLPEPKANGVARSYPTCLRCDLVGGVSAYHNQGAAGRWEE